MAYSSHHQNHELSLSKHFKKCGVGGKSQLCPEMQHLIERICGINLEGKSVEDVYQNEMVMTVLREIEEAGVCAQQDRENIMKHRQKSKVFGITGDRLDTQDMQLGSPEDTDIIPIRGLQVPCSQEFETSLNDCKHRLHEIEHSFEQETKQWTSNFSKCMRELNNLSAMMQSARFPLSHGDHKEPVDMDRRLEEHRDLENRASNLATRALEMVENSTWFLALEALCDKLIEMMGKWRIFQAWVHFDLTQANAQASVEGTLQVLDNIFKKTFDLIHQADGKAEEIRKVFEKNNKENMQEILQLQQKLEGLESKILHVSWTFEIHPEVSLLNIEKLSIVLRLHGLSESLIDLTQVQWALFLQSEYGKRYSDTEVCTKKPNIQFEDRGDAIGVRVKITHFEKAHMRAPKRSSSLHNEQFYRFALQLKFRPASRSPVEYLSLPFCLRTGSNQLWSGIGSLTWYIFAVAENLYCPPFEYPARLKIDQVVHMIHALVQAIDSDKSFTSKENESLRQMLRSLKVGNPNSDTIEIKEFVMNPMPYQGKRRKETRPPKFPCFAWVIAARNTHEVLMEHLPRKLLQDFMNEENCESELRKLPTGSAMIRISCNQVDSPKGQKPFARIVVPINSPKGILPGVASVSKIQNWGSMSSVLASFKDGEGKQLVRSVQDISMDSLEVNRSSPCTPEEDNGYIKTVKKTSEDIILLGKKVDGLTMNPQEPSPSGCENLSSSNEASPAKRARCSNPVPPIQGGDQEILPSVDSEQDAEVMDVSTILPTFRCTDEEGNALMQQYMKDYAKDTSPVTKDKWTPVPYNEDNLNHLLKKCTD